MENTIKAILIDDDNEALMLLEIYLKAFREIKIIGISNNGEDGLKIIGEKNPDLVFLDIDMPGISGIEVARSIKERNYQTEIIFTTAFNDYAFDVINTEPLDYLVKPFGEKELKTVIEKYKKKVQELEMERKMEILVKSQKTSDKIRFKTYLGLVFIHPDDIVIIRSKGNNCELLLNDGTVELVSMKLVNIPSTIDYPNLYKISRFTYINLRYLRKVDRKKKIGTLCYNQIIHHENISECNMDFFEDFKCFPIK